MVLLALEALLLGYKRVRIGDTICSISSGLFMELVQYASCEPHHFGIISSRIRGFIKRNTGCALQHVLPHVRSRAVQLGVRALAGVRASSKQSIHMALRVRLRGPLLLPVPSRSTRCATRCSPPNEQPDRSTCFSYENSTRSHAKLEPCQ